MYKIKQNPEDFFVKEESKIEFSDNGEYSYFILKKKNYTTLRALQHIANFLKIHSKKLSFSGTKDKNAITEQAVSVKGIGKDRIEGINLKDISVEYLGRGDKPLSLGDLKGNYFKIIVRDCSNEPVKIDKFRNFFGEQRFSVNNADIGKAIVKKDFQKAVELVMENDKDYRDEMQEHLNNKLNDFIGALRKIPKKILKIYVHAYQSLLWNKMAKESSDEEIELIGFGTRPNDAIKKILKEEGIVVRDFIIKSLPELSPEGDVRKVFVDISNLKINKKSESKDSDNAKQALQKEENVYELEFSLPKGSYATEAIKQMFTQ